MDYFREDSAHVTGLFLPNEVAAHSCEDRITHKRWAKAILAFYASLFLVGAAAVGVHQSMTRSGGIEQAALHTDIRSTR